MERIRGPERIREGETDEEDHFKRRIKSSHEISFVDLMEQLPNIEI